MSDPSLTRVDPSTVDIRELPRSVDVIGARLNRSPSLSLLDDGPAHLAAPTVRLNDQLLEIVEQPSTDKLVVQLPPTLQPGAYNISVRVGGVEVRLEPGLHVTNVFSQALDASSATEMVTDAGSVTVLPTEAGTATLAESDTTNSNPPTASGDGTAATASAAPTTSDVLGTDTQSNSSSASTSASSGSGADGSSATDTTSITTDPVFRCEPGQFGSPEVVTVEDYSQGSLWGPTLSADGFTLYFTDGSEGSGKLMKATRSDRGNTFVDAEYIPALFPSGAIGTPYLLPGGLSLYFYSIQVTGLGSRDMFVATRNSPAEDFTNPTPLTALNSNLTDHLPWVSSDELWFVWVSDRDGKADYWTATRASKTGTFSTPRKLPGLTSPENDGRAFISSDGLVAYFAVDKRPGGNGSNDIWYSTRARLTEDFRPPRNLDIVNTADGETDVTLTHDGEELFFVRTGDGNVLYRAVANCN